MLPEETHAVPTFRENPYCNRSYIGLPSMVSSSMPLRRGGGMKELLGIAVGLGLGFGLTFVGSARLRAIILAVGCVTLGAVVSWVNGEGDSRWWLLFVSFDAVMVWAGALLAVVVVSSRHRLAS